MSRAHVRRRGWRPKTASRRASSSAIRAMHRRTPRRSRSRRRRTVSRCPSSSRTERTTSGRTPLTCVASGARRRIIAPPRRRGRRRWTSTRSPRASMRTGSGKAPIVANPRKRGVSCSSRTAAKTRGRFANSTCPRSASSRTDSRYRAASRTRRGRDPTHCSSRANGCRANSRRRAIRTSSSGSRVGHRWARRSSSFAASEPT